MPMVVENYKKIKQKLAQLEKLAAREIGAKNSKHV